MSISFSRNVRNAGLISALVIAPCLAINPGSGVGGGDHQGCSDDRTQCSPSHHTNRARQRHSRT